MVEIFDLRDIYPTSKPRYNRAMNANANSVNTTTLRYHNRYITTCFEIMIMSIITMGLIILAIVCIFLWIISMMM
ncbi:putative membrane protein [Acanthamoeba polyphaga mimivirus]|nr:putative membrane protein [Mimivirus reunion]WMV61904.1 putative membrane protein [Mimivirus sp.]WMV62881.1 putative membrane protein [Acanthamoeba polyphaga mimivirus]WMV63858.1 putative membrane protein [Mimivirus sp.]